MENRNQIIKKENNQYQLITEFEVESKLDILVKGQTKNYKELQAIREERGFIGLALRNEELLKSNDQLKQQLDGVLKELNLIKQEREEKAARKKARANLYG